jgi:hypothetical protein
LSRLSESDSATQEGATGNASGGRPVEACAGLIGLDETEIGERLGAAISRTRSGESVWLVFRSGDVNLRVRCEGPDPSRVASWTATFARGYGTLQEAARELGLWPAVAPDESAAEVGTPLIRRPFPCPVSDLVFSLTATVRGGLVTQISVFHEAPDWL